MKKILLLVVLVVMVIGIAGCGKTELSREPIDSRYTEPYSEIVTDYEHKYSVFQGKFVLVPNTRSVRHPGKYEILYSISYDDGTTSEVWEEVDYTTYQVFNTRTYE